MKDTVAVLTLPRLGWNDFWGGAVGALIPSGIDKITYTTGVYWHSGITTAIQQGLEYNPKYLLLLDSDTIFTSADVLKLRQLADDYLPDAVAGLQVHRRQNRPLFSRRDEHDEIIPTVRSEDLAHDVLRVHTAHLGFTMIRADKLLKVAKPWFYAQPDADGEWGPESIAPDTWFWNQWRAAGNDLYIANRIPVGHLEAHIRWPDEDLMVVAQHAQDYTEFGKPTRVWK